VRAKTRGRGAEREATIFFIITKGVEESEQFTALKVPRQRPLVLLVMLGWNQAKALGSEAGGMVGSRSVGRTLERGEVEHVG